jgi:chromosome partitioning protein
MKTIAIATRKGGAAKTTTAVHMAHALARADAQTLLVDLDSQGHCATWLGRDPEPGLHAVVVQDERLRNVVRQARPSLDLLPGNNSTIAASKFAERERLPFSFLLEAIHAGPTVYDYVVFDSPPLGWLQEMALSVADALIVPAPLDALSVDGVRAVLAAAAALRHGRPYGQQLILPTFMDNTGESAHFSSLLQQSFPGQVAPPIPRRVAVREAVAYGQTLFEYAPGNAAADAYQQLANTVAMSDEEILFGEE